MIFLVRGLVMEKRKTAIWIFFWTFWTMVTTIVWQCSPAIINYPGTSFHAAIGQCLHGIMLVGVDVLIVALGYVGFEESKQLGDYLAFNLRTWITLVITGVFLTIIVTCLKYFHISDLYTALFPILRNEVPFVTGILGGMILRYIILKRTVYSKQLLYYGLFGLLWVSFIFGNDFLHLNDISNPLVFTTLFVLGGILKSLPNSSDKYNIFRLALCIISSLIIVGIMPYISQMNHANLSIAERYTTIANPLFVIIACYCVRYIFVSAKPIAKNTWLTVVIAMTMISMPSCVYKIKSFLLNHAGHSTIHLLVLSAVLSALILLISLLTVVVLIRKTKLNIFPSKWYIKLRSVRNSQEAVNWLKQTKYSFSLFVQQKYYLLVGCLMAYLLAYLSLVLTNLQWKSQEFHYNIFMITMFRWQPLVLFNTVLILSLTLFIWAIVRRYYISLVSSSFLVTVWIMASRIKIIARNEPIMPSELKMINVWGNLIGMAGANVILASVVMLTMAIVLLICLEKFLKNHCLTKKQTVFSLLFLPLLLISSLWWNHNGNPINAFMRGIGDDPKFFNQLYGAQSNGSLVQFLNNIYVQIMSRPIDYSKSTMITIRKRYQKDAQNINRTRSHKLDKQTIIFNLSESFSDPQRVPGVQINKNPIPVIDEIKRNNTSGIMVSSGYGGGTANMEYMTMTGFALSVFAPTMSTPYTQLVNSLANNPTILGSYRHSTAIHPYLGTFYNRNTVYEKFGFDKFYYLDGKHGIAHQYKIGKSPYLSDKTAYANVFDQLNRQHSGQFIQLATMQNHLPFNQNYYRNFHQYRVKAKRGADMNSLRDYTLGIHFTDIAVGRFIQQIDKIQRPITVVFYGDHLPGSIYNNSIARDGLKLHETDYFIYSNKYAREHGATQKLTSHTQVVDPNDFIALVAEQTNSKVNWYQAMLTDVLHQLPAFALNTGQHTKINDNGRTQFVDEHGKFVSPKHWTKKQKQLWHDYKLVQYDVTAGKQYLVRDGQLK